MLLNVRIIASLNSEIKKQKTLLKSLETREKDYNENYEEQKKTIKNSIEYMEKIILEAK